MRRLGATVLLMALAGCGKPASDPVSETSAAAKAAGTAPDLVPCAMGEERPKPCAREIVAGPDGPIWIIRRSDGGFRRFAIIDNGRRIATADGADEVRAERASDYLDVRVANEFYRFPDGDARQP